MAKARIGVIGVGWWGTVGHLEPLSHDPRAKIVAVWSRTEAKARQRAEAYGVPAYYTDYCALIDQCELDAVVVASTPNMHYQQARYALERGLPVLMEKPFVLSAEHANDLGRLAEEKGALLSVCHPEIFTPALARARQVIRGGELGDVVLISAVHAQRVYDLYKGDVDTVWSARPNIPRPNSHSYADPAIVGGGEGYTQASHILGSILWLTGLEPVSVYCAMNPLDTQVDVIDAMVIRFAHGALATVGANGLLPRGVRTRPVQVHGSGGILDIDPVRGELGLFTNGEEGQQRITVPDEAHANRVAAVERNFVSAVLGEEPLYVETQVALDESRILAAAYESAACGHEVAIVR